MKPGGRTTARFEWSQAPRSGHEKPERKFGCFFEICWHGVRSLLFHALDVFAGFSVDPD